MKTLKEFLNESLVNEGKVSDFFDKIKRAAEKYSDKIKNSKELSANLKKSKKLFLDALPNGSKDYDVLAIDRTVSKNFEEFWDDVLGVNGSFTEYYVLALNTPKEVKNSAEQVKWSDTISKTQWINFDDNSLEFIFACDKIDDDIISFKDSSWKMYPTVALFDITDVRLNDPADIADVIAAVKENDADDEAYRIDDTVNILSKKL